MLKPIPLDSLEKSPLNERQTDEEDENSEEFQALVRNIEAVGGVNDPPLVQTLDSGGYGVIKGSRRVAAARQADGVDDVLCEVQDLDDGEALKRSITDNIDAFKRDVPARDRAAKLSQLWALEGDTTNPSPTGLADLIGMPESTVSDWLEPLSDEWEDTFVNPLSDDKQVSEVRPSAYDLSVSKLRAIRLATGGGEAGERLANETAARELTADDIREAGDLIDDGLTVDQAAAVVDGELTLDELGDEDPKPEDHRDPEPGPRAEAEAEPESEPEPEAASNAAPRAKPMASGGRSEGSVTTVGQPQTVNVSGGIDARRGARTDHSTETIFGGLDTETDPDDDGSLSRRPRPISFANEQAREQLVDHGTVVTFRGRSESTGPRPWNAARGERPAGEVIVAEIGEVDPSSGGLEEYVHLSGFKSVEEWREAIGVADDEDDGRATAGTLYLVVLDREADR